MPEPTAAVKKTVRRGTAGRPRKIAANKATEFAPAYHHGALPEAMLAAARHLLETEGLEGLTLRAAARAAGVSHAAPKNHFGDLTGLLSELAAIGFQTFSKALETAADSAAAAGLPKPATTKASKSAAAAAAAATAATGLSDPSDAMRKRFRAIGLAYVRFATEHPALFLLMFRSERLDMQRPALRTAVERARQALAGGTAERMGLKPVPPSSIGIKQSANMVAAWSLVHGFALLLIDGRLDPVLTNWPAGTDWQALLAGVFDASFHA